MRLALVADWLPTFGGAEHVLAVFHDVWPAAPIFTTVANRPALGPLASADIRTSSLQPLYRLLKHHQYLLPLLPRAIERIDLAGFDLILSSSHAVGKGIIPPANSIHICYCHTPIRYAWEMEEEYLRDFAIRGVLRKIAKRQLKILRRWDLSTAKRVDLFLANSTETQERIERIYGRESRIIHPPVDDQFFEARRGTRDAREPYYLALGRFVPYKKFDLLIELANRLKFPLKIAGTGDDAPRLKHMAGPTVEFLGLVADGELPALYAGAQAVLFPQHEDAGLVPLESLACGTPVIAYGKGGVLDAIQDGVTGILVPEQTVEAFAAAIERSATLPFDRERIRTHARRYSRDNFEQHITQAVAHAVEMFGRRAIGYPAL